MFGDQLKKARKNAGFTQREVAEKIGVATSTYTGYEIGNSFPTVEAIQKIMSALGIDANFLWQDEMEEKCALTEEERKILKAYRSLDYFGKKAVEAIIDIEKKRTKKEGTADLADRW